MGDCRVGGEGEEEERLEFIRRFHIIKRMTRAASAASDVTALVLRDMRSDPILSAKEECGDGWISTRETLLD